jgi:hypothetical protein
VFSVRGVVRSPRIQLSVVGVLLTQAGLWFMSTQVVSVGVRCAAFLEVLFYISCGSDCFTVMVVLS